MVDLYIKAFPLVKFCFGAFKVKPIYFTTLHRANDIRRFECKTPRCCFGITILLHWPLQSKDVLERFFVNVRLPQTMDCHVAVQSRSFYQNTEKRQSKNPSSITFFCCRREYKITIDLAAFDRTGPCWQQRYRFTTKGSVKTRNVYNYNLIEENFAPNKEVFDTKRRATWIACLSFTLIAHRTRSKVNNQCGIMCLSSVVSWLQWSAHWW